MVNRQYAQNDLDALAVDIDPLQNVRASPIKPEKVAFNFALSMPPKEGTEFIRAWAKQELTIIKTKWPSAPIALLISDGS